MKDWPPMFSMNSEKEIQNIQEDIGHPKLRKHLTAVIAFMKALKGIAVNSI